MEVGASTVGPLSRAPTDPPDSGLSLYEAAEKREREEGRKEERNPLNGRAPSTGCHPLPLATGWGSRVLASHRHSSAPFGFTQWSFGQVSAAYPPPSGIARGRGEFDAIFIFERNSKTHDGK